MRWSFTILVLTCFGLKQFSCCGEHCVPCANAEDAHAAKPGCASHAHEHEHESPAPADGSHHICVATHLFYLSHDNSLPLLPDFSVWEAVSPLLDSHRHRQAANPGEIPGTYGLPPHNSQRLRAVLNVWVI